VAMAPTRALRACAISALLAIVTAQVRPAKNPFENQAFYLNPTNSHEFDVSIASASGATGENLKVMQKVPSAYWIDVKAKVRGEGTRSLEGILKDASSKSSPELVVLIWYDLPNRDCDAKASNGEICCYKNSDGTCDYDKTGDCSDGIEEYKSGYADPFVSVLKEYEGKVPIVVVLEPDSLPNLATNSGHPHCGNIATQTAYKEGISYAMKRLTNEVPFVSVYLDAAHGGWLGWENNIEKFMGILKHMDLPMTKIRGFATNVANYQPLGFQCPWCPDTGYRNAYCLNQRNANDPCCADPCKLLGQYNPGNNELNYAADLVAAADAVLGMQARVIIDTGRNGISDNRQDCKHWCNPRGAGAGVPSTTDVANTTLVDAYFWLKTPGESDGCSQTLPNGEECPRFDEMCGSVDSLGTAAKEPPAPEAGHWFDYQVKQLAANAHFKVGKGHDSDSKRHSNASVCPVGTGGQVQSPAVVLPVGLPSTSSKSATQTLFDKIAQMIAPSSASGASATSSPLAAQPAERPYSGSCARAYQQCGGKTWTGADCCESGCSCSGGEYYKQCIPPSGLYTCRPLTQNPTTQSVSAPLPMPPPRPAQVSPMLAPPARVTRSPVPMPAPRLGPAPAPQPRPLPAPQPLPAPLPLPAPASRPEPEVLPPAGAESAQDFCCFEAEDMDDPCGSCLPGGSAGVESFCGRSKDHCHGCGSAIKQPTWCPGVAWQGRERGEHEVFYMRKHSASSRNLLLPLVGSSTPALAAAALLMACVATLMGWRRRVRQQMQVYGQLLDGASAASWPCLAPPNAGEAGEVGALAA